MASTTVRRKGFRIQVSCPGRAPNEDGYEKYLSQRNLDGAVFFRSKSDDSPVAIGGLSDDIKAEKFKDIVGGVMAEAVACLVFDGSLKGLK